MSDSIHELLVGARNAIAQRGHAHGRLMDDQGGVCVYGGYYLALLGDAAADVKTDVELRKLVITTKVDVTSQHYEFCRALGFPGGASLIEWNDEATEEEVFASLDAAIAQTAPEPDVPKLSVSEDSQTAPQPVLIKA